MAHLPHLRQFKQLPHLFGVSGGGAASYGKIVNGLSPSARYKLEEASGTTMVASVGTSGTYSGAPTFGQVGAVRGGGTGTRFASASTQFGSVTVSGASLPTGAMTAIAWVRLATTGAIEAIITNGGASFNWFWVVMASGKLQFGWADGVGGFNNGAGQNSTTALTTGVWNLVTASVTAGTTPTVSYTLNGVADGSSTGSGQLASGNNLQVGANTSVQTMDGWMNDVMVIPSVVSVPVLLNLYNEGFKTMVSVTSVTHVSGISAKWLFDTNFIGTPATTAGNLAALEYNASGLGYISPATAGTVGSNFVQPSYAGATIAGDAWRILSDVLILNFGTDHYLRTPSSGVAL